MEIILGMILFSFFDTNMWFVDKELIWVNYIIAKALFITKKAELVSKKKLTKVALDKNSEIFVVYIAFIMETILIYLVRKTQIALL